MEKKRRRRRSRAERDADNARIDEDIRRLRELAEKGWAELERKGATAPPALDQ
jgi:hypothetical protein